MTIERRDANSRDKKPSSGVIEFDRILTDSESPLQASAKSGLDAHQETNLTPEEVRAEKKLRLKIDFIILPIVATIYFLAALDRSDVGNAAIAGMDKDLNMTSGELSYCVAFFYIGFMLFQLPGAILLRVLTPPVQLGCAAVLWGAATTIMTEARSWQTIAGLRVVVGAFEAFIQGAPLYLTFWYKPHELATRGAIFLSMTSIAGSANGLIAYAIQTTMDGRYGRPAWRWIFLVEGIVSIGFGAAVFFILPNTPERVKRGFTAEEKAIALRRSKEAYNVPHTRPHLNQLVVALRDPKTWFYSVLNGCSAMSQAAWSQFLPVIIKLNGYTANEAQIMAIPVFAVAGVTAIAIAYLSDRLRRRGMFLTGCALVTAVGWLLLIVNGPRQLSYAGTFLIGMGSTPMVVLELAWLNNNIIGYTKK
ncbi:major facilitator superfamily domain-containing protein [Lasiosphaeris hirsuta]|uniref:Major facilitator superfamily domain-containing protein n=1 Tax=Lasiosphaeris hirsuta TaxID=260670 RepID=A0AA39ZPL6_9PEZI|nr:major facilitator superfamily domain-containing protein [Lasiosphaeris hirsuta]